MQPVQRCFDPGAASPPARFIGAGPPSHQQRRRCLDRRGPRADRTRYPAAPAAIQRLSADARFNSTTHTTCVATRLAAGHANNALPQLAQANVNCRILRAITRAEVAKEDNALTHHCDDQGYDYGDNRAVSLHIAMLPDCWLR